MLLELPHWKTRRPEEIGSSAVWALVLRDSIITTASHVATDSPVQTSNRFYVTWANPTADRGLSGSSQKARTPGSSPEI